MSRVTLENGEKILFMAIENNDLDLVIVKLLIDVGAKE
jgi:hypothetical protein